MTSALPALTTIGFDADDTLWHNESIFDRAQQRYRALLAKYHPAAEVDRVLFQTEMRNLPLYGVASPAEVGGSIIRIGMRVTSLSAASLNARQFSRDAHSCLDPHALPPCPGSACFAAPPWPRAAPLL